MTQLTLTVNGEERSLELPPSRYLAEVLRYDLGLTGAKIGCDEAECGCCTVIVDGQSVDSCIYPAFKAQGAQVLTIEGLAYVDARRLAQIHGAELPVEGTNFALSPGNGRRSPTPSVTLWAFAVWPCRSIRMHCCWRCETARRRSTVTGARRGRG